MNKTLKRVIGTLLILLVTVGIGSAQRRKKVLPPSKPKPIIFAVLDDGKTLEPIAEIDKGKLVETTNGGSEPKPLAIFTAAYYKPKTQYDLIFGGASKGKVTVKSSDPKAECQKNLATVATQAGNVTLKEFVMALATNAPTAKNNSGVRRLPTAAERTEIESLVRANLVENGVSNNAAKNLHYYNLTAIDTDNDGKVEMVGSFWAETSSEERNLLFFIADKNASGKYQFGYSEYKKILKADLMSGDFKDLDTLGGELMLDLLDYNGDGNAEIFTISRAFEGNNFQVYSRSKGKWTKTFEGYNYHCAY